MRAKKIGKPVLWRVTVTCGLPGCVVKSKLGALAKTGAAPAILFCGRIALIPAVAMFVAKVCRLVLAGSLVTPESTNALAATKAAASAALDLAFGDVQRDYIDGQSRHCQQGHDSQS